MTPSGRNLCRILPLVAFVLALCVESFAQASPQQRAFPQSPAVVERALRNLGASAASGRLPVLDGFAQPGSHPMDHYQRGYYQCTTQVLPSAGGTVVKVTAKITAWYSDPVASQSGYQVLPSNGRLETDFLDRLQDALNGVSMSSGAKEQASKQTVSKAKIPDASLSAPVPNQSVITDAISASRTPLKSATSASLSAEQGVGTADRHTAELEKEAEGLQEILRNQAHPNNLAAVKRTGTPVLISPNEGAKLLFQAQAEDEFEILDMNASWVHVRISGLSRGWIQRSALEMPGETGEAQSVIAKSSDAASDKSEQNPDSKLTSQSAPPFQVESEQTASFPGDWEPLRGKTVRIISVQKSGVGADSQARLTYGKSVFEHEYADLVENSSSAAGVVIIFDSEDGGMMATTMQVLKQWKSGNLTDEALWRHCYFDPPEAFTSSSGQ